MTKQTQSFQAEIKELLDLMIHSLYSHREIFLRELVSNASDAIDKLKFEGLTNPALLSGAAEFEIRVSPDKTARTLTITDNGIGMTRDEIVENLGTIAHSGTKRYVEMRREVKDNPELIGQFGVGFYSSFMVAEKVEVITRKAGTAQAVRWESSGTGTYTLEDAERAEGHGTTVILHLKSETQGPEDEVQHPAQDFTDEWTLKGLIKKYSDFIAHPIRMRMVRQDPKSKEMKVEDELLNSQQALWLRPASEIKPEEYNEFYKHLTHDWVDPLKTVHFKAEGTIEFSSIFYIPAQKPWDYHHVKKEYGLNLYVKRVFIMNDCEELLPQYLRFVRGMVDSSDLSLNVSREMLQQDRQVLRIRKALTNKVFHTLKEMLEKERPNYEKFWLSFGPTLKEAVPGDNAQKDTVKELLLYKSTAGEDWTTLKDYVARMKPEQKAIYFITGESLEHLKQSPYLERVRAKGFEVLFMTDPVDEWVMRSLFDYDSKPLQSIMAENLDLDTEDEKKAKEKERHESETRLRPLLDKMKASLGDRVKDVRVSGRLTESAVCLVSESDAPSANMERIMEAMGQSVPKAKRVLEVNPGHPLFERMLKAPEDKQSDWTEILYDQALLNEGGTLPDPLNYSKKIAQLMIDASGRFL